MVVVTQIKVVFHFTTMASGEQYAKIIGTWMMRTWCVECWDTQELLTLQTEQFLVVLTMGQYGLMTSTAREMRARLQLVHMLAGEKVTVITRKMRGWNVTLITL